MSNDTMSLQDLPPLFWIVLIPLVLMQGTCIFLHARKHGHFPWLWAVWGLMSFPVPGLLYTLFVAKPWRNRKQD